MDSSTTTPHPPTPEKTYTALNIGLTAPVSKIHTLIDQRIADRINSQAEREVIKLLYQGNNWDLPSMSASGYPAWREFLLDKKSHPLIQVINKWRNSEHAYVHRQLTWFKKHSPDYWFDICHPDWKRQAQAVITKWYNQINAA